MTSNNKISNLIESQLPFFVRNDHPGFVQFIEAYYEYLEQEDGLIDRAKNLQSYMDIDRTIEDFAEKLYNHYMSIVPASVQTDKTLLMKHIKEFYLSRGTEKSIRFLMNILFREEDVEIYYPKKDILRVSDGKWYVQKSLRVSSTEINGIANTNLTGLEKFVNRTVTGNTSGATAIVERVDRFTEAGTEVNELIITGIIGNFNNNEQVFAIFDEGTITANTFSGVINSITITNGGSAYSVGDIVLIESSVGSGANAIVSAVSVGNIASISVLSGGAGFRANDYVLISGGGGGTGANAIVSLVLNDSSVHPNSYNISISTIGLEANSSIVNSAPSPYESYAYPNLAIQYMTSSNLTANTGNSATRINLSAWKANSNVFFETFDTLNVNNNILYVTSCNIRSNIITVQSPGLTGAQTGLSIQVIKRANANTSLINAMNYFVYSNTGPAVSITINDAGTNYTEIPSISIIGNNSIQSLGILGRMEINHGGTGYAVGEKIEFINVLGGYGTAAKGNVKSVSANGSITSVEFEQVPGHIIGGEGYSYNYLPTANVITTFGINANISVTAILGTGGSFIASNTTLGTIERILIVNRGLGYTEAPTINLSQSGDGTATANATVMEGAFTYPGRYLNDDGQISSYNFIQNKDYYQNFSYVVRVRASIDKYRKALKDLIHPAGMKLFGEYITIDNSENDNSNVTVNDTISYRTVTKPFEKTGNVINIHYDTHGFSQGDKVYLSFSPNTPEIVDYESNTIVDYGGSIIVGGPYEEILAGKYTITNANSSAYFEVIQKKGIVRSIQIINPGLNYNANAYLVFTADGNNRSNGTFNVNSSGSIVSVRITDYGRYYNSVPSAYANGSNSVSAEFIVTLDQYANTVSGNVNVSSFIG